MGDCGSGEGEEAINDKLVIWDHEGHRDSKAMSENPPLFKATIAKKKSIRDVVIECLASIDAFFSLFIVS